MATTILDLAKDKENAYTLLASGSGSAALRKNLKAQMESEMAQRRVKGQNMNIEKINKQNKDLYATIVGRHGNADALARQQVAEQRAATEAIRAANPYDPRLQSGATVDSIAAVDQARGKIMTDAVEQLRNFSSIAAKPTDFPMADVEQIAKGKARDRSRRSASAGGSATILGSA